MINQQPQRQAATATTTTATEMPKYDCCLICCLSVPLVISLLIGLPTFLMGCNSEYYKYGCAGFNRMNGVVVKSNTQEMTCDACYSSGDSQICTSYTCYGAFVDWSVCVERLGTWSNEADAISTANKYYKGLEMTVWVEKAKADECTSNSEKVSKSLPITGIVFLSISGALALALIIVLIVGSLIRESRIGILQS